MLDSEVCKDLNSRLGGAPVAVWGDGELYSALCAGSCEGLSFSEEEKGCGPLIFTEKDGADYAAVADGRPFVIISGDGAPLEKKYGCACMAPVPWDDGALNALLRLLAGEFCVRSVNIDVPEWMRFLPHDSSAISELIEKVRAACSSVKKVKDISSLGSVTEGTKYWSPATELTIDFSTGDAHIACFAQEGIFFDMLSEIAGDGIDGEYSLMRYVRSAAEAKRGYEKVRDALDCARVNGYGIVTPADEDLSYEQPCVVKQGSSVGIKLRASAPTYHIIRVDVSGEVSPIMGESAQSESLVSNMMSGFEKKPEETWNTDVFGRSLKSMVQEGLNAKVNSIQEETRSKLRKAITRMANEGKGGVICIIL